MKKILVKKIVIKNPVLRWFAALALVLSVILAFLIAVGLISGFLYGLGFLGDIVVQALGLGKGSGPFINEGVVGYICDGFVTLIVAAIVMTGALLCVGFIKFVGDDYFKPKPKRKKARKKSKR